MRAFVTRFLLVFGLTTGIAFAGPLVQIKGGHTTIFLSEDMLTALTDCRLEPVKPSNVKPDQRRIRMRVVGGALDTESLAGEATHNGGVTITCWGMGTESVVSMQNFLLDSLQDTPEITALVSVDGGDTERIPVLVPNGELDVDINGGGNKVIIRKIKLLFTTEAIDILENLFAIPPGDILGSAWSRIRLRGPDKPNDDFENENENEVEDEVKDKPEKEREGVIGDVSESSFVLLMKKGEQCVDYGEETSFYLDEDDDSGLKETDSSSLVPGYEAEVYGEENSEGCIVANKVVVEEDDEEEDD